MKQYCFLLLALFSVVFLVAQRTTITDKQIVNTSLQIGGGTPITRTMTDGALTGATNADLATAAAVKTYVDGLTGGLSSTYFPLTGGTLTGAAGAGFLGLPSQSSTPSTPASGFRIYSSAAYQNSISTIGQDGYTRTFITNGITTNRTWQFPDVSGTVGLLERSQTFTGNNTFQLSGTGGAGFNITGTGKFAINAPVMTEAQRDALTSLSAGGEIYNSTKNRKNYWNGSAWVSIPSMVSGGITANQVLRGDANGNIFGDANFVFDPTASVFFTAKNSSGRGIVFDATDGTDRPNITTVGSPLWIKITAPTLIFNATSNIINVGPSNAGPLTIFTSQAYFGGSNGVGIASASAVPLGLYAGNTDTNTKSFNFNSAASTSSANTDYFYIAKNSVQQFTLRGNGFFGFGSTTPTSFAHFAPPASNVTGDLSGAGYGLRFAGATYTNTTTAASGTVAAVSAYSFGVPTIASTNTGVVYTVASTVRIDGPPVTGANSIFSGVYALQVVSGNSLFGGAISATGRVTALDYYSTTTTSGYFSTDANLGISLASGNVELRTFSGSIIFKKQSSGTSTMGLVNVTNSRYNGNLAPEIITGPESGDFRYSTQSTISGGANGVDLLVKGGDAKGNSAASVNVSGDLILQGGYHSGGTLGSGWDNGEIIFKTTANASGNTPQIRGVINAAGGMTLGATTVNSSAILDLVATDKGLLIPRGTTSQINAVTTPPLLLMMGSTTDERIHLKRTNGFYQLAYVQDIKRDTAYRTVNANLDLSGLTTTFANRYKRVVVETIVTVAASGNNTITMPVPTASLLGTKFEISVEDTSGDSDISVLSFGTDGTDGYLYNGDGTYSSSQNLYPGLGVYVSVSWCEAKSAYRWKLQ